MGKKKQEQLNLALEAEVENLDEKQEETALLSPVLERFLKSVTEIRKNPEVGSQNKIFIARQLVQATLPHSDPGDVTAWQRTNGNLTLIIQQGWDGEENQAIGYPYGTIPRLLLFWLTTEVARTKSRRIELGKSMAAFMKELGLDPSKGGKRSDGTRLREQMMRLFHAKISFQQTVNEGNKKRKSWLNMDVTSTGQLWWDISKDDTDGNQGSWIELGEDFFQALLAAPVPIDFRVLRGLKNSSLAMDLYAWITYRTKTVSDKGEAQFIEWRSFMDQFGSQYDDYKNFVKKVKSTFRKIKLLYPAMNIKYVRKGFMIYPSTPSVPEVEKTPVLE